MIPLPDDLEKALPFYTSTRPISLPPPDAVARPSRVAGQVHVNRTFAVPQIPRAPAVSNVRLRGLRRRRPDRPARRPKCAQGLCSRATRRSGRQPVDPRQPSRIPITSTPVDLDSDGLQDLLIADLGEFFPGDHHHGAVIWMRGLGNGKFGRVWLDGWPRVADVEAGRLQRRRQARSGRRGLRLPQDRANLRSSRTRRRLRAALVRDATRSIRARAASTSSRST